MKFQFSTISLFYFFGLSILLFSCKETPKANNIANLNPSFSQIKIDRFESEINAFEMADSLQMVSTGGILFTGSSSIRMWRTLEEDMTPLPVTNRGFGGSTIPEVLHYFDRIVLAYQPKIIVLYCGENDIHEKTMPVVVFQNFKKFVNQVWEHLPETQIVYLSMKPSISRWQEWVDFQKGNKMCAAFAAAQEKVHFLDVAPIMLTTKGQPDSTIFIEDGLHMNEKGYERWAALLKPLIEDLIKE